MLGRRPFLFGAALPCAAWRSVAPVAAAPTERWIWAQNHAGEEVAIAYRAGEAYHPAARAGGRPPFEAVDSSLGDLNQNCSPVS